MNAYPTVQFSEILLRKVRLRAVGALSPYVLRNARPEVVMDHVADRLIARLDSHVLGLEESKEYEITEEPVYRSWRHHLVATLPHGYRRRFLTYFWGFEGQPLMRQVTHTVTATGHAVFPEAEVQMPREWGSVIRYAAIDDYAD